MQVEQFLAFTRKLFNRKANILLHEPVFIGKEKEYLIDCINSTFVSYAGKYVTEFEEMTAQFTGSKYAVAVVNGTAALQIALLLAGVKPGDEVITQPLTFVATANAISHCGAAPVFIDVDLSTMGMSPEKLEEWCAENSIFSASTNQTINKLTNKPISAIVPMHTFGFPCKIEEIVEIANKYNIPVIEDSAESLGSYYKGKHTGTFGLAGILSYNANKIITAGGGGMIITDCADFAKKAKHLTTTAKLPHRYEFVHDEIAFNYRLTNVNAAIGVAQMEQIDKRLINKRETAAKYHEFFKTVGVKSFSEPENTKANYWLNAILLNNLEERNSFLEYSNNNGVMTRPVWKLLNKLEMYKNCQHGNLENSEWLEERVVSIPSGVRL
jgi:perosamine synthetase